MSRKHTIVYVGGTWEPPAGMGEAIYEKVSKLRPGKFRYKRVIYPARYADGMRYEESIWLGRQATVQAVHEDAYPCILVGYSQGADIAGTVAAEVAHGNYPDLEVTGCGLVADTLRHRDQTFGLNGVGHGIRGERWIPEDKFPVWQIHAAGDGICDLPPGNPMRSVADLSYAFSTNPRDADDWFKNVLWLLTERQYQRWWDPAHWRTYAGAIAWLKGYVKDGRHTTAYWTEGHVDRLVKAIADYPFD